MFTLLLTIAQLFMPASGPSVSRRSATLAFKVIPSESPSGAHVSVIDSHHVWVGLSFTADGGRSWYQATPSAADARKYIDDTEELDLADTWFNTASSGWLSAGGAVWHTTDAGLAWSRQFVGDVSAASFFAVKTGWMGVRSGPRDEVSGYVTHDGGQAWQQCGDSLRKQRLAPVSVSFVSELDAWAFIVKDGRSRAERRGVARTRDGGCSWTPVWWDGGGNGLLTNVQFANRELGWMWGAGNGDGCILETRDGGVHWLSLGPIGFIGSAYPIGPGRGWYAGTHGGTLGKEDSGLFFTNNLGKRWESISRADVKSDRGLAKEIPADWGAGVLTKMDVLRPS
jgi:photosystem II stability/assembly factor-like uncharacterized protein